MSKSSKTSRFRIASSYQRLIPPGNPVKTSSVFFDNSVRYSDNIHGWASLIRSGSGCTTTAIGVKQKVNQGFSSGSLVRKSDGLVTSSFAGNASANKLWNSIPPDSSSVRRAAESAATRNFINSYRKSSMKMPGYVTAGEIGETLRGLRSPGKALWKGIDDLLSSYRKNVSKAARMRTSRKRADKAAVISHAITNTYLEWMFGMRPTMSDVDGAARALAELADSEHREQRLPVIGEGKANGVYLGDDSVSFPGSPSFGTSVVEFNVEAFRGIKGAISSSSYDYPRLFEAVGLTMEEFVPSVVELIPFSFLAGYFVNFADVIDRWSYQKLDLAWCFHSNVDIRKAKVLYTTPHPPAASFIYRCQSSGGSAEIFNWHRYVPESAKRLYAPDLSFTIPGMGTKWINIAALSNNLAGTQDFVHAKLRVRR